MQKLPTHLDAVSYVLACEARWGLPLASAVHVETHKGDDSTCGEDTVRVSTEDNIWDVWMENGNIYGEC